MPENISKDKNYTSNTSKTLDEEINPLINTEIAQIEQRLKQTSPKNVHLEAAIYFTDLDKLSPEDYDSVIEEITSDLLETPFKPGRIAAMVNKCELDLDELRTITDLIVKYTVKPASIEKLMLGGIPISEMEEFLDLYKKDNGDITFEIRKLEPSNPQNQIIYTIPNAGNFVSYNNLVFVRKIINNGTAEQVKDAISNLDIIADECDSGLGAGVIIHRMRELYNKGDRYQNLSFELMARLAINSGANENEFYDGLDEEPEQ